MSGWYSQYAAHSMGRILHFVYEYCGLRYAESVTIGSNGVFFYGEKFADVEWKEIDIHDLKVVIPFLKFYGKYSDYAVQQEENMRCAIMALNETREKLGDKWMGLYAQEMNDRTKRSNEKYGYKGGDNGTTFS